MKSGSKRFTKGFTLIELLVVISIIAVLSAIVLAALSKTRLTAADASIKEEVLQLAVLMNEEYNDNASYANLQLFPGSWVPHDLASCSSKFTGTYAAQATALCQSIINNIGVNLPSPTFGFETGINTAGGSTTAKYFSIMAWLPSDKEWYCAGSSGGRSEEPANNPDNWLHQGCYSNP